MQDPVTPPSDTKPRKQETYSGPSVLSWSLDGRKATHLPIPAYRCVGAGEVTVIITVNNQGKVMDAKIDDGASSKDGCLRSFATRAARLSKFNASATAPARQMGTITYLFIAQYSVSSRSFSMSSYPAAFGWTVSPEYSALILPSGPARTLP